jgi:hypothetical protein
MRAPNAPTLGTLVRGAAVLVMVLAPGLAHAQDRRLVGRLDADMAVTVTRLADSVRAAGLPYDPVIAVALEGTSRRASNERILSAVREYAAALGTARQTLGESAVSDEIVSAAGVIVAGVAPGVVSAYRAARPTGSLTVPFVVLADLIARGVPVDTATVALGDALRGGAGDDQLSELRRRIERDILAGLKPAAAMSIRSHDLPSVQPGSVTPKRTKSPRLRRPGPL